MNKMFGDLSPEEQEQLDEFLQKAESYGNEIAAGLGKLFNPKKHDKKPKNRERHHARENKEKRKHVEMKDEDDIIEFLLLVYVSFWVCVIGCCGIGFCAAIYKLKTVCDEKSE